MKTEYFKILKNKVTKSAIVDVVRWGKEEKNEYLLTRVFVPKEYRGKGIATKLLNRVVSDADKECSTLLIEPRPYEEITDEAKIKLKDFYKKFGFEDRGEQNYMIRHPKCNKKSSLK